MNKELFEHIIITGFEGGINYWACLENDHQNFKRHYENPKGKTLSEFIVELLDKGQSVYLFDTDEKNTNLSYVEIWELNKAKILNGYNLFVKEHGEIEIENIDSQVADNIFQYALFGELIYG